MNHEQNVGILIVRMGALGDIVHGLPVVGSLRKAFPKAHLGWMVDSRYEDLLTGCPAVDVVLPIETKQARRLRFGGVSAMLAGIRDVRHERFSWAVDLQGLVKSGVAALLSGASRRVGFGWGLTRERFNPLFMNRRYYPPASIPHNVHRNLFLVQKAFGYRPSGRLEFPFGTDAGMDATVREKLRSYGLERFAILSPGGGWTSKLWPLENYLTVGNFVARELGLGLFINYGPGEEHMASWVLNNLGAVKATSFRTSVREYVHLARCASLYIGSDSGPYHIAMGLGVRAVGLFGPTDPARCGPLNPSNPVVRAGVDCAPCYKRSCRDLKCMNQITPGQVMEAARKALAQRGANSRP